MRRRTLLPRLDYRATSTLRPGSIVEYELTPSYTNPYITPARMLALITRIDWAPQNVTTRVHVLTPTAGVRVISMTYVCKIIVL